VVGVLRAHQHNDNPSVGPMLSRVREAGGVYDNWNASGMVLTFLSGAWIPSMAYPFDSYGLLSLPTGSPSSWRMQLCNQRVGELALRVDGVWRNREPAPLPGVGQASVTGDGDAAVQVDAMCNPAVAVQCVETPWRARGDLLAAGAWQVEAMEVAADGQSEAAAAQ